MDDVLWVGPVEIHVKSSDWLLHKHSFDAHYKNVILHVVYEDDVPIFLDERPLKTLVIQNHLPHELLKRYQSMMNGCKALACEPHLPSVVDSIKIIAFERMMIERFEQKTHAIQNEWENASGDWELFLQRKLCQYLFGPVNAEAAMSLLERLPISILRNYTSDLHLLEALLFGCAGLIPESGDQAYVEKLNADFTFLKHKHGLYSLPEQAWKFLRLRPAQFPTIRIAQLASLYHFRPHWFSHLIEKNTLDDYYHFFQTDVSDFWKNHFHFKWDSKKTESRKIGKSTIDILLINVICPTMFAYGSMYAKPSLCEYAFHLLQSIQAEENHVSKMWKSYNFALEHAGHSQAGIQLYQAYCVQKKCTRCLIGAAILKTGSASNTNQASYSP